MSTSTVPAVLDAFCDGLRVCVGLASVHVWSGPQGDYSGENIVLGVEDFPVSEESMGLGSTTRKETYSIPCWIWVAKVGPNETGTRAARDRGYEILEQVEEYLNTTVPFTIGSTCMEAEMGGHEFSQGPYAGGDFNGYACAIKFGVDVVATKVP